MQDPVDDSRNYKYGFYYNPDDSRLFVPKRVRFFGYTLNFGRSRPFGILVIILMLVFVISILSSAVS